MKVGGLGFRSAMDEVPKYLRVSIFLAYAGGTEA